jgi:hypothetical protein
MHLSYIFILTTIIMKKKSLLGPRTAISCVKQPNLTKIVVTLAVTALISISLPLNIYAQSAVPLDSYVTTNGGEASIFVKLPDTISVSEIEVLLGSKINSSDIFSHVYVFDQYAGLPSGLSYSRNGVDVYLGTGSITVPSAFFAKIRLKNGGASWSNWLEYVSN